MTSREAYIAWRASTVVASNVAIAFPPWLIVPENEERAQLITERNLEIVDREVPVASPFSISPELYVSELRQRAVLPMRLLS